jgi:hypothetical protein
MGCFEQQTLSITFELVDFAQFDAAISRGFLAGYDGGRCGIMIELRHRLFTIEQAV